MEAVDALGNGIRGLITTQKRSAGLEKVRFLPIRQKSNICHCNDIEVAFDIAWLLYLQVCRKVLKFEKW